MKGIVNIPFIRRGLVFRLPFLILGLLAFCSGCKTVQPTSPPPMLQPGAETTLSPGAIVRISFPDAPQLDNTQQISSDGLLTLPSGDRLNVIGMTPAVAEKEALSLSQPHSAVAIVVEKPAAQSSSLRLREGDVLRVSFPGAPDLNTTQPVRRDGIITLPMVGEIRAAGLSPAELEKQLLALYAPKLVSKEVNVNVESSTFPIFVTGAVLRPGRVSADRALTTLEAIMEAGGFDYTRANLKAVRVIRREQDKVLNYTVNLKVELQGRQNEPFFLKPMDIVYVPEKFNWF